MGFVPVIDDIAEVCRKSLHGFASFSSSRFAGNCGSTRLLLIFNRSRPGNQGSTLSCPLAIVVLLVREQSLDDPLDQVPAREIRTSQGPVNARTRTQASPGKLLDRVITMPQHEVLHEHEEVVLRP
ncbi:hypothetical protein ACFQ9X_17375 [Catenulispora yoronensis]